MTTPRSTVSLNDTQPGMPGPGFPGARGGGSLLISATSRATIGTIVQNRFCADCPQVRPGPTSSRGVYERGSVSDESTTRMRRVSRGGPWRGPAPTGNGYVTPRRTPRTRRSHPQGPPGRPRVEPVDVVGLQLGRGKNRGRHIDRLATPGGLSDIQTVLSPEPFDVGEAAALSLTSRSVVTAMDLGAAALYRLYGGPTRRNGQEADVGTWPRRTRLPPGPAGRLCGGGGHDLEIDPFIMRSDGTVALSANMS